MQKLRHIYLIKPSCALKSIPILMFFLAGCAANPIYMRAYSGIPLQKDEVANIKPTAYLIIHRIDSQSRLEINPSGPNWSTTEYDIELPIGEHNIEVSYDSGVQSSANRQQFKIFLQPRRRYIVRPIVMGNKWRPVLVDVTDKPHCWTLSVGVMTGPKGCDPN